MHRSFASSLLLVASAIPVHAQFVLDPSRIPQDAPFNNSPSENVDFADVDLDGDWDAAFADGGDLGDDQNRLWINQGGLQGGTTGFFSDETQARFPAIQDSSRDVEFGDIDSDGDPDLFIANHSSISTQSSRWWVNVGGTQGGTPGFFADQTAQRWVGIAEPGSSLPSALPGGGFEAWSGDGDFADLDNDGDLDLVHSSYGPAFFGNTPTRIFLNDGNGYFEEFNPSGFQLAGSTISTGDPALWCEGTQLNSTQDFTGMHGDIASSAIDIDLGDIDGDFDIDMLHGARQEVTRMFANRLDASSLAPGGGFLMRDVTGLVFDPGHAPGTGHYEQEMGDMDGDGDLDILGVNWDAGGFAFGDTTFRNRGDGTFAEIGNLAGGNADDSEGDFIDYDSDGDLDIFIANFAGQDRLYRNNEDGGGTFSYSNVTNAQLPNLPDIALDADAADLDGDGDYDLMVSHNFTVPNVLLVNSGPGVDTSAPHIARVEQPADRACSYEPTVVRAQVYDNAPYYITQYNLTWIEVSIDNGPPSAILAQTSGGQIFRAQIPGWITGQVCVTWHSRDEYGNEGVAASVCYESSGTCQAPSVDCLPAGANSVDATGAKLQHISGQPGGEMTFRVSDVPRLQFGVLFYGNNASDLPFGCGRRCVTGSVIRSTPYFITTHAQLLPLDTAPPPTLPDPFRIQFWYRDPANFSACGAAFNLSNALSFF